jgi:4-amino-4-deoxy-L-arabinose transferase-like glycosyltransferase
VSEHPLFRRRISSGALLLLALVWLAGTLWLRPLALPDEGRYAGVAWEMVRSGHWLTPTLDGLPYFHKPPLFYWITASALSVFGNHEWAARLAPLAGALAGALVLYRFARRWAGEASARLTLLALATQPLFFVGAQFANLDMLVAGCIAVTILAAADALLRAQRGETYRGALALAFLFAALGLLAKGLIGAVLPGLVILAWLAAQRRPRLLLPLLWLPGFALFLAVAAPWFLAMQARFPAFANYFFVVQHFKRFAESGFNNAQPFYFYPVVLALLTLPWFAWLPRSARSRYWRDPQQGPTRQLMWVWIGVVTLFFSMPQSKLVGYILPVTFPLAYLIGDCAAPLVAGSQRARRLWQASGVLAGLICLATVIVATVTAGKSLRELGRTLAREAAPQDVVVFVQDYYFDLPFYARLPAPALVVDDWSDPKLTQRDNWRKELFDARQFSPPEEPPVLIEPDALPRTLCGKAVTWVVLHSENLRRYPELARGSEVARHGNTLLLRVPAAVSRADCPGMPSVSSPDKS